MNDHQANLLREMGIGPIWKLRQNPHIPELTVELAAKVPVRQGDINESVPASKAPLSSSASAPSSCRACGFSEVRTNELFGGGELSPHYMFVGENSLDEGSVQEPAFAGASGSLLDNMLHALGVKRGSKAYIANIIKSSSDASCGNVSSTSTGEISVCLSCLKKLIEFMQPSVILALGETAATSLLGLNKEMPLNSLRGQVYSYQGLPLVVTYHPSYLLRQPREKSKAWSDLCLAMKLCPTE